MSTSSRQEPMPPLLTPIGWFGWGCALLFILGLIFSSPAPRKSPEPQRLDVTIRFAPLEFTPKRVEPVVKFSIPEPKQEPL